LTRTRSSIIGGGIAGLGAGLAFAGLHALIIVPIWSRMLMGLVFGIATGLAAGWGFAELTQDSPKRFRLGVSYGFMLWLAVVPVTLANSWIRSTGFNRTHETWTDVISFGLAILGGAALGLLRGKSRRAIVAGAAAVLFLTMAMGGPVPVGNSVRAVEILIAVLLASVVGGVSVAYLDPLLRTTANKRFLSSGTTSTER